MPMMEISAFEIDSMETVFFTKYLTIIIIDPGTPKAIIIVIRQKTVQRNAVTVNVQGLDDLLTTKLSSPCEKPTSGQGSCHTVPSTIATRS